MPEMHLRQPGFTYSACGPFTKNKERIQKFKETGDSQYIYQNELDKACFQNDMAYGYFKDLTRRKASAKAAGDNTFNIAKNPKYDGYQGDLASMVFTFFDKKTSGSGIENEKFSNQGPLDLAAQESSEELHKPNTRKSEKREGRSLFIDSFYRSPFIFGVLILLICN